MRLVYDRTWHTLQGLPEMLKKNITDTGDLQQSDEAKSSNTAVGVKGLETRDV